MDTILLVVGIMIGVAFGGVLTWAYVAQLMVFFRYQSWNRQQVQNGLTGEAAAKLLLEALGLTDVAVVKANWFMATLVGNSYSARKKMIRLRRGIINKSSVTAVSIAAQKVALAVQHKNREAKFLMRSKFFPVMFFGPFIAAPLTIVGVVVDVVLFKTIGWVTILFAAIGLAFFIGSFVYTLLTLPVEKKACKEGFELLTKANMLTEDQLAGAQQVYKSYILKYVADFVLSIMQIIRVLFNIVLKATNKTKIFKR